MSNLEEYLKLLSQQDKVKEEEITIKRNITLEKLAGNKWNEDFDNYNKEKGCTSWIDLSSFNLSSLANSPNLSASSSINSLLSSLVSRNSSNDNLCKYLVIAFRSNEDQSISGWDSASSLRFSGIFIINSAMFTRNKEKYIKFDDMDNLVDCVTCFSKLSIREFGTKCNIITQILYKYENYDNNKRTVTINGKIKSLHEYASWKIYQGGELIKCHN